MEERNFIWRGKSGNQYKYSIHPIGTSFKDEPGNYIFSKETSPNQWTPIYIGETKSLRDRLMDHDKLPCVKQYGGTHIHAHLTPEGEIQRIAEEHDLLEKFDPPCNKE